MKNILFGLFIVLAWVPGVRAQAVAWTPSTSTVCVPVTVPSTVSSTMTTVDVAGTITLPQILSIENQDSSHLIYCSGSSSVATSGANLGWAVAASNGSRDFTLLGKQQWYCIAASAPVQTLVCKTH